MDCPELAQTHSLSRGPASQEPALQATPVRLVHARPRTRRPHNQPPRHANSRVRLRYVINLSLKNNAQSDMSDSDVGGGSVAGGAELDIPGRRVDGVVKIAGLAGMSV